VIEGLGGRVIFQSSNHSIKQSHNTHQITKPLSHQMPENRS